MSIVMIVMNIIKKYLECAAFLILLGQVFVKAQSPVPVQSVTQAEGLDAVFQCSHPDASIIFLLNNAQLIASNTPPGVVVDNSILTIPATPQYNNSVIECRPFNFDEGVLEPSNATLTIFTTEFVNRPANMADSILVSWNSELFTNLSYCLDVRRTEPVEEVVESVCGLTGPDYSFQFPEHSLCDRFSFTVTPTSGGMNGTTSPPETGYFTQATGTGGEVTVSQRNGTTNKTITFNATLPTCTNFSFSANDDLVESESSLGAVTISNMPSAVSLMFDAPTDQRISFTLTLTDVTGIDLVYQILGQSTHDVQGMSVSPCEEAGCVSVSLEFVEGSLSPGALICLLPAAAEELTLNNTIFRIIPSDATEATNISVPPGEYRVVAFDLESNGLPRMPSVEAALSASVTVTTAGEGTVPPTVMDSTVAFTKFGNNVVEVVCNDISLDCLVLLFSPSGDQRTVDIINDQQNRAVNLSIPTSSDGGEVYVAVITWTGAESIFTGSLALLSGLDIPPPTTPPTTDMDSESPASSEPDDDITGSGPAVEGLEDEVIAGSVVAVVLVIIVVPTAGGSMIFVYKYRQRKRVFIDPNDDSLLNSITQYSQSESGDNNTSPQNGGTEFTETTIGGGSSQYAQIGPRKSTTARGPPPPGYEDTELTTEPSRVPQPQSSEADPSTDNNTDANGTNRFLSHQYSTVIKPPPAGTDTNKVGFYDVLKKENLAPHYQTVDEAKKSSKTQEAAPPELPPRNGEEGEPPPLPPPYDPAIDKSMEMLDTVGLENSETSEDLLTGATGEEPSGEVKKKYIELDCDNPSLVPGPVDSSAVNYSLISIEDEPKDKSQYAEVVHEKSSDPPKDPNKVVYTEIQPKIDPVEDEISKEHQYAVIDHKTKSSKPPAKDPKRVVYSTVDPTKLKHPDPAAEASPGAAVPAPILPPSQDSLYTELGELSGRWEDLAKALGMDEDRIDEIFTYNENDQLRLHGLIEYYFTSVHYKHSWEEVVQALSKMEEHGLADKISKEKLQESLSGQTQFSSLV